MVAAILFELTLPLTPAQVLWVNLVTSATLGVALAFERSESDVMARDPRPPGESLLSGYFLWRVCLVSVLMAGGALTMFLLELRAGTSVETARTMAGQWRDARLASLAPPYGPEGTFNDFKLDAPLKDRIDYVFVSDRFTVHRYAALTDSSDARYPSDHLPVVVRLSLR